MFLTLQVRTALLILVVIISIGLVFFVYRNNKNTLLSNIFALLNLSLVGWLITVFLAIHPFLYDYSTWWARLSIAFGIGLGTFIPLLAKVLVDENLPRKKYLYSFLTLSGVIFLFCLSPYVFIAAPVSDMNISTVTGWGMYIYAAFTLSTTTYAIFKLVKGLIVTNERIKKMRLKWVFYGFLGMHTAFIFSIMLPIMISENANYVQFGGFYILFFLFCVAIAILKYELFNIKAIATEALVILLNSFLFVQLAISSSVSKALGNAAVFFAALLVSYLLLKSARGERRRSDEQIQIAALAESNQKLIELDKQKTEFLTIAAHQLRTPVSIINNYIGMLQDGDYGHVADDAKKVLANIDQSNQWLVRLADEFLNIANLEQGQTKFHFTKVNLANLITKVVEEIMPKAQSAGMVINYRRPEESAIIDVDEEKIKHVLLNLLDNAVKYGKMDENESKGEARTALPGAGIEVEIKNEIKKLGNKEIAGLAIRVIDHGIGFDKDDEQRFFQKFSRGNNAKAMHVNLSTGLGLYIAKKFVEGHNGHVWAKSEGKTKGSEFGVWLPVSNY